MIVASPVSKTVLGIPPFNLAPLEHRSVCVRPKYGWRMRVERVVLPKCEGVSIVSLHIGATEMLQGEWHLDRPWDESVNWLPLLINDGAYVRFANHETTTSGPLWIQFMGASQSEIWR